MVVLCVSAWGRMPHLALLLVLVFTLLCVPVLGQEVDGQLDQSDEEPELSARDSGHITFGELVTDWLFGLALVLFTPAFLWMVEVQVVHYEIIIRRCQLATRTAYVDVVDQRYESAPVLLRGNTLANESASDEELGYRPVCTRLSREVEMYQWKEVTDKKSVRYELGWHASDQSSFKHDNQQRHENPPRVPDLFSRVIDSDSVSLGAYTLCPQQVRLLQRWEPCHMESLPAMPRWMLDLQPEVQGGYVVFNGSLATPRLGSVRVSWKVVKSGGRVTTVAVQRGNSFRSFTENDAHRIQVGPIASLNAPRVLVHATNPGSEGDLELALPHPSHLDTPSLDLDEDEADCSACSCLDGLECCGGCCFCLLCRPCLSLMGSLAQWSVGNGILLLEEAWYDERTMFKHEWSRFRFKTWVLRLVCYLLLGIGFYLVCFAPIAWALKFIPFVGWFVDHLLFVAALLVGLLEGALISALASITHRPLVLSMYLLVAGLGCWMGTGTTVLVGKVLVGVAVAPLLLWAAGAVEEWRYVRMQAERDKMPVTAQAMPVDVETTPLLKVHGFDLPL